MLKDEFANEHEFKEFARGCLEYLFFEESSGKFQFPVEIPSVEA